MRNSEIKKLKESILERPDRFKKLKTEYRVFINWAANVALWSTPIALMPQLIAIPKLSIITWLWLACNSTIYTLFIANQKSQKQLFVRVADSLLHWAIVLFILLRP